MFFSPSLQGGWLDLPGVDEKSSARGICCCADVNRLTVERRLLPLNGTKIFLSGGIEDDTYDGFSLIDQRERDRVVRQAFDKGLGAIDGVEDPDPLSVESRGIVRRFFG